MVDRKITNILVLIVSVAQSNFIFFGQLIFCYFPGDQGWGGKRGITG
jgi:hypothetical protein